MNEQKKIEQKILILQASISILTFIITPIITWFVVDKQLSGQHKYWNLEQDRLSQEHSYEIKLKIYEDTAGLINRLNNHVLAFQVYTENKYIASILSGLLAETDKTESSTYLSEFRKNREKAEDALFKTFELSSSLHQQQAVSLIVFSNSINQLFVNYFKKIEQLQQPLLSKEQIKTIILKSWSVNKNPEEAIRNVTKASKEMGLSAEKEIISISALIFECMIRQITLQDKDGLSYWNKVRNKDAISADQNK